MSQIGTCICACTFAAMSIALTPSTRAQTAGGALAVDASLLEVGEAQYIERCAQCHGADGQGQPPTFPALAGNPQLEDIELIVETVHSGRGAMPPYRELDAETLTGLAAYIRNSWGNGFGEVTVESAEEALETISLAPDLPQQGGGWYTKEQALRGAEQYLEHCAEGCHGADFVPDEHSTGLTGAAFVWHWEGRTLYDLFETIRTRMPFGNEGGLANSTYIDIVAYLLEANGFPPGDEELPVDDETLSGLLIDP